MKIFLPDITSFIKMSYLFVISTLVVLVLLRLIQYIFFDIVKPWFKLRNIPTMPLFFQTRDKKWTLFPIIYPAHKVKDVSALLQEMYQDSDYYSMRKTFFLGRWLVQVRDPLLARQVLATSIDAVKKLSFAFFPFENILQSSIGTDNLVFANDEKWKRMRRIINPVFRQEWDTQGFADLANKMFSQWEKQYDPNMGFISVNVPYWMQS
jgi:cytochrome P450